MQRQDATGDLEQERDLAFQRREWMVQRVAWVAMTLILLAALAGLLGSGPLSSTTTEAGPLAVEYNRFERRHAPTGLVIRVAPGASSGDRVEVWLPVAFVESLDIESVMPEPAEVRSDGDRIVYAFAIGDPSRPFDATFALEHNNTGSVAGAVGLVDGPEIAFRQIVYP